MSDRPNVSPVMPSQIAIPFEDITIVADEFKGLNPDLWVEIAVRQCLNAALADEQKYALAVENLEAVLITKLDDAFYKKIDEARAQLKGKMPELAIEFAISKTKFKELVSLIDRKIAVEATLEL